jgi:hypothetical protein
MLSVQQLVSLIPPCNKTLRSAHLPIYPVGVNRTMTMFCACNSAIINDAAIVATNTNCFPETKDEMVRKMRAPEMIVASTEQLRCVEC